jgi:hypothetical protein
VGFIYLLSEMKIHREQAKVLEEKDGCAIAQGNKEGDP